MSVLFRRTHCSREIAEVRVEAVLSHWKIDQRVLPADFNERVGSMPPCGVALEFGLAKGFTRDGAPIRFGVKVGNGVDRNEEKSGGVENCDSNSVP